MFEVGSWTLEVGRFCCSSADELPTSNFQRSTSNKRHHPSVYARQTPKRKRGDTEEEEEEEEQCGEVTDKVNWRHEGAMHPA